ncbi:diadenylate cyclase CdaA [Lactiplantibacillus plantarum]|uniref:diadenylate cyclase CdaA n=1 Tax=Lactiplantibacillus plantarum TaxID=1590 RepID=UPI000D20E1BE|nr:diadenylate cyclase CdaA [Lactiplantibacillus plantarum]AVV98304.1 TIGR00159 family protein [Lactiplantibacillus plantarum]AVW06848.1 TIGR00159 family protein [Lactiplantibacillus plantarum]MBG1237222.1 TIGR00159 family protein [Lactiplantibacillus plantarum subsp. plantarum]MCC9313851.1 TIGR00159 family protein [Lactiplantibacillus plantarum]MDO1601982.1 diadenylate cyclase CdaA [Lactiplantibacillus plantarum]
MTFNWSGLLTLQNFVRLLDILAVWFVIYELIVLLKGTKAVQLFRGIVVIAIIKAVSVLIGLDTVSWIMDQIINWAVIAMVIIFQPEIRRGLEHLGRGSMFARGKRQNEDEERMIAELDKAIQYMAKRRIGALMSIKMDTGLEDYIETGIALDADITGELLINIFIPNTPLHDGAVIIQDNQIKVAAAYLPLSESNLIPKELGTRHRAAVGISEVTDALTIVISEETGEVSITKDNELMRGMTRENYLRYFRQVLLTPEDSTKQNALQNWFGRVFGGGPRK